MKSRFTTDNNDVVSSAILSDILKICSCMSRYECNSKWLNVCSATFLPNDGICRVCDRMNGSSSN